MAEAKVTITMAPTEYRLMRNELELHQKNLMEEHKALKPSKAKTGLNQRINALRFIVDKI